MSLNNIWTKNPRDARANSYGNKCVTCHKDVTAMHGYLVSKPNAQGVATANAAVHPVCAPAKGWFYRAKMSVGQTLPDIGAEYSVANMRWEIEGQADAEPAPAPAWTGNAADTPEPPAVREPTEAELKAAAVEVAAAVVTQLDDKLAQVPVIVRETLAQMTRNVDIKVGTAPRVSVKNSHKILPDVVMCVAAGTNPFLVGPAGSGKTTLCQQVADVLKRQFYAENRVTSEYKLLGYMDATGKYVRTQFREAFEHGGVFLLDEVDASDPDVLTTFNSALANHLCPFPDKLVKAHKNFVALAAGNTYGRGADRQYVGRNQLDAATLDRFVVIETDYDEVAELAWAGNDDWTLYVQQVRAAVEAEKVRHVVSPRASIYGAKLLAAGMDRALVEERVIWKGLDAAQKARVAAKMGAR